MRTKCYIGIDTSNYTTSVAACDEQGRVIANLKKLLPVKEGACGLRQSDALFAHTKQLPALLDELSDVIREYEIAAVGVSKTPRSEEGSYMPCFLAGVSAAHALSAGSGAPLYRFSHQDGHVMAAAYSSGRAESLLSAPFYAFHVSGGTTEALLVTLDNGAFSVKRVGGSQDLHAGQVIDRIGVMLGLSFPCGNELEGLASLYEGKAPTHALSVKDGYCNLSGLENLARGLYERTGNASECAAFVFDYLGKTLCRICVQLNEMHGRYPVLFAGGVMSNRLMRSSLSEVCDASFAEPEFSADNAAGISLLCRRRAIGN